MAPNDGNKSNSQAPQPHKMVKGFVWGLGFRDKFRVAILQTGYDCVLRVEGWGSLSGYKLPRNMIATDAGMKNGSRVANASDASACTTRQDTLIKHTVDLKP